MNPGFKTCLFKCNLVRHYAAVPQLTAAMGELIHAGGAAAAGAGAGRGGDDAREGLSIFVDAEEQRRLEMTLSVLEATVRGWGCTNTLNAVVDPREL